MRTSANEERHFGREQSSHTNNPALLLRGFAHKFSVGRWPRTGLWAVISLLEHDPERRDHDMLVFTQVVQHVWNRSGHVPVGCRSRRWRLMLTFVGDSEVLRMRFRVEFSQSTCAYRITTHLDRSELRCHKSTGEAAEKEQINFWCRAAQNKEKCVAPNRME